MLKCCSARTGTVWIAYTSWVLQFPEIVLVQFLLLSLLEFPAHRQNILSTLTQDSTGESTLKKLFLGYFFIPVVVNYNSGKRLNSKLPRCTFFLCRTS